MINENCDDNKELSLMTQNSSNDFLLLLSNIKDNTKLINSIITFINEYFDVINVFYKQLDEINNNFLKFKKSNSSITNSPIHHLGKTIKKMIQLQIDSLINITSNQKAFSDITSEFSNLLKKLKNYQDIVGVSDNNKSNSKIQPVIVSLMKTYGDIEDNVINQYINKKYNKSVFGLTEDSLESKLEEAYYLEKTFFQFEEQSKEEFLKSYKELAQKTLNSFNLIKGYLKTLAEVILKQNNVNIYEIQKEIDFIGKIPESKDVDKNPIFNSNINLKKVEKEDMFKYRIKIIMIPNIQVIDNITENQKKVSENSNNSVDISIDNKNDKNKIKKKKEKEKKKDKNEDKDKDNEKENNNEINEDNSKQQLYLTEEDIYNIVITIYSYELKLVDKTQYALDLHKELVEVQKLSEKLLSFDMNSNISENISDTEVERLNELLNKEENSLKFYLMMNNYRATGRYETTERAFNIFVNFFRKTQDYLLKNKNEKIESLIIIMSQTFYLIKDGQKIYIQEKIKDHELFKNLDFWEIHIKNKIEEQIENNEKDIEKMNITFTSEEKQKRLDEIILSQFIPLSSYMKNFGVSKEIILDISNKIFQKYNTSKDTKTLIFSLINK